MKTLIILIIPKKKELILFNRYEKICGSLSSYNLCVTDAMLEDLKTNWSIRYFQ